jgi:hypothetical protein
MRESVWTEHALLIIAEKMEFYRWLDATVGAIDALISARSKQAMRIAKDRPLLKV